MQGTLDNYGLFCFISALCLLLDTLKSNTKGKTLTELEVVSVLTKPAR